MATHERSRPHLPAEVGSPKPSSADNFSGAAMTTNGHQAKRELYLHLVRELMADPAITEGTMMGLPCLRLNGAFFASLDRTTNDLIVKLPAARVTDLIDRGTGSTFAPNHRPFREWVAITRLDPSTWADLLWEAKGFAGTGS